MSLNQFINILEKEKANKLHILLCVCVCVCVCVRVCVCVLLLTVGLVWLNKA